MKVPEESIKRFNKEGYLPVENILSISELEQIRKRLEDIAKGETDFPEKYIQIEPKLEGKNPVKDISTVRKISHLTKYDSIFTQLARKPEILAYVKAIIGPDLKVYLDQTMCKQAYIGSAKPPHQDSAYWTDVEPRNQIICWIAVNDSTIENGCMRYIPGSHKGEIIDHKHLEDFRIEDKDINYEREVAIPLKAGSCCFHHSKVLHRTGPNLSSNGRIGVTIGYMSSKTKYTGDQPKPRYLLVSGKEYEYCV